MKSFVRIIGIVIVVSLVCFLFGITSVYATVQYILGDADGDRRDRSGETAVSRYDIC